MKITLSFLAILCCLVLQAQKNDSLHLTGTFDRDSGSVVLFSAGYDGDYPAIHNFQPVPISHGRFAFSLRVPYPIYVFFRIAYGDQVYMTDGIYLSSENVHIECHADSLREWVDVQNASMLEYNTKYRTEAYWLIDTIGDWYKKLASQKYYLYQYAQKNPDSWVALGQISKYISYGYNKYVDSAIHVMSPEIRNSATGKLIQNSLSQLALVDTGRILPDMMLTDIDAKQKIISFKNNGSKYTLVDFWFAHCDACNSEFPGFIELFKAYHQKGFSIVGISNDVTPANIKDWITIIKNRPLPWVQYRTSQRKLDDFRISYYPSNFLLDGKGKILAINIGPYELSELIKKNLN